MATRITTTPGSGCDAWDLEEHDAMALPRGRIGTTVRVHRGTVLVTQEGDREDHVLETGDELALRRLGRVVAWAFTPATLSLCGGSLRYEGEPEKERGRRRREALGRRDDAARLGPYLL